MTQRITGPGGIGLPTQLDRPQAQKRSLESSFDRLLDNVVGQQRPQEPEEVAAPVGQEIRFSRHAAARLESRGIELQDEELATLSNAIDKLDQRGAKESLVLMGDRAYVVGVPKRTIITVMSRSEALGNVFTNIDSTFVAS